MVHIEEVDMDGQLIAITEAWFRCVAVPHKNGAVLVWFTDTHWPRHLIL
jgi:hypothetical protein